MTMVSPIETTMRKAIRFGTRFAHKGHGHPFVVFYFVSNDLKEKPIGYFDSEGLIDFHFSQTIMDGQHVLFLPFAPVIDAKLHQILQTLNLEKIVIGMYAHQAKAGWNQISKAKEIPIVDGVMEDECRHFNEVYLYQFEHKKPFIALSFGMSMDGKIATKTGDSRYISGPETRAYVHKLRHYYQAILVGINTIKIDHPKLTARLIGRKAIDPDKIVLDSHLSIALDEPIFTSSSMARTIIVTLKNQDVRKLNALRNLGAIIVEVAEKNGRIDLIDALDKLYQLGIDSIFVEGGSTVHFSFIKEGLFNVIYAYISPLIIGGKTAPSAVGGEGFAFLKDSAKVTFHNIRRVGSDIVVTMRPTKKG